MTVVTRRGKTSTFDIHIAGAFWGQAQGMHAGRHHRFTFKDAAGRNILRKDSEKMLPSARISRIDATLRDAPDKIAGFVELCIAEGRWPAPDTALAERNQANDERQARAEAAAREKQARWELEAKLALQHEDQVAGVIEAMKWAQAQ